ncbi:MAG TPA: tRNA lysidine(34) synthetase TilS [Terracidiphilus sp.]
MRKSSSTLPLDTSLLKPGMRLAVGLSGGADSVTLLCALHERTRELGIVLHAAHLHHGLRGAEADADLEFCRDLATKLGIPFHEARVDTAAEAGRAPKLPAAGGAESIPADSIEGTARRLRYAWFRQLMHEVPLDAVATAHTLDDQAETVLAKFLRGAWTEGFSGIHPTLNFPEGMILRPFLETTRPEIEGWLHVRNQRWREDSTNRHLTFTRNRIRHELLPQLENWNPKLREHLVQMAELARGEESWWQTEMERLAAQIIVRGRPVRGGGRATTDAEGIALDLARLTGEPMAVQRRVLRYAAAQLGSAPDFAGTEALRSLVLAGKGGQKLELAGGLRAERTHREIRLTCGPQTAAVGRDQQPEQYEWVIPGEVSAAIFGCRVRVDLADPAESLAESAKAILRCWKPGDRVRLRYSSGPRKIKEVLERMKVTGAERIQWPVLEVGGRILWMRGAELEPHPAIRISVEPLET